MGESIDLVPQRGVESSDAHESDLCIHSLVGQMPGLFRGKGDRVRIITAVVFLSGGYVFCWCKSASFQLNSDVCFKWQRLYASKAFIFQLLTA